MKDFNDKWRAHLKERGNQGGLHDNQAYKEFYRTKGLSAWNYEIQPIERKTLNQYCTLIRFLDGSCLKVSSNRNKVDRNFMRYYPSAKGLCFADRALFGCGALMPWEVVR